jgi:two-component system sensor histidine kinase UhpB
LVGERVFGVVNVESSQLAAYSDHDLSILETLAGQIAVAVQNVQLFQSLQEGNERLRELNTRLEEVEEAERKRLANELHDQVGQNLSAINLSLNLIRSQLLPEQNATLGARVDDSLGLLEETVQRIRSVMTELRPSILDDYGLPAALRWLGEQFAWRTGVQVEIDDQVGERLLTPIQETALFRISQETLANISKHAAAEHVRIVIQKCANGDCFCLIIEDDGIGFSNDTKLDKSNSSGWGVNIMRERAVAIGGKLWINTTPLTGTRVVVEVPLQGEENDHSGIVG